MASLWKLFLGLLIGIDSTTYRHLNRQRRRKMNSRVFSAKNQQASSYNLESPKKLQTDSDSPPLHIPGSARVTDQI